MPAYASARGSGFPDTVGAEALEIARWDLLYSDPLFEVRRLGERSEPGMLLPPNKLKQGDAFRRRTHALAKESAAVEAADRSGLADVWPRAVDSVASSEAFMQMCSALTVESALHRHVTATAIVASAQLLALEAGLPVPTGTLRDQTVREIGAILGASERGVLAPLFTFALTLGARLGTNAAERRKRTLTDAVFPFAGDVLVYQTRGEPIRSIIRQAIEDVDGPVVLLAHSLGGIACVDLLVGEPNEKVTGLITVGSQSPFLYELDCLSSLRLGQELPDHFPRWLNIYDPTDLVSFVGTGVFPQRVEDFEVRSRQPFPASHSAYWSNPRVWDRITEFLS